jgi:Flp pilus assembly protein TadD
MMQSRWYWKQWRKEYQIIWYGAALLFIISLLLLWYSYFVSTEAVIHWEKFHDQQTIETTSHTFQVGNFEFSVPIESYLSYEYFNGSGLEPNIFASYSFVAILIVASMVLLSIITTFEKFWYFVGTGLFILFIVSLRLDVLRLFGLTWQWTTIGILIVYVPTSFYFNSFRSSASFTVRLGTFLLITTVLGILLYFLAGVPYPFLHLSVTGYIPGMILSVIFMIMIAHEILASFIYLTSQGSTSSKSLMHFSIISAIYIANLILAYMHEAGIIKWNFLYVNLYLLLTVSVILSLWGYRQREKLYQNITRFNPFGAYFVISLATITFITIAMLLGTANDPALKVIRDFIIFTHLGFGIIFLMYIFSNFILMFAEDMNVYKVLYTPNRMPYFTYRFAGVITMLAFVFYSNWHEYVYNSTSGFYNNLGDLYQVMEKRGIAEAYYQQGRAYGFQNHHSNYIIGHLEGRKNNLELAHYHYELANGRRPTEFSAVNKGNLYLFEERFFNAIFSFKDALRTFPDSGPITNNLGYTYTKIHLTDSALLMLGAAREQSVSKESAEINFMAFVGQEYIPVKADSLVKLFGTSSKGVISNGLVVAILQKQSFTTDVNPLENKELNLFSATLLNNYVVNKLKEIDTTFTLQAFQIASDSVNEGFSEALKATLAQAFYHQNNVNKAFQILAELAYLSQTRQGKYNYVMGLWALEQGNPQLAALCFEYAVEYSYKEANLYSAIALAESQQQENARIAADTLIQSKNENEKEIGRQLKKALTISFTDVLQQSDLEKYQYFRYRIKVKDSVEFNRIINSFSDNNYRAQALLEMSQRQFDSGNAATAIRYFMQLEGLQFSDKILNEKIKHFELELLASRGQLGLLASKINDGITFNESQQLEKVLYTALLSEVSGDTTSATLNYKVLATYNPFYEEGIIASARYFKSHSADPLKAYTILTDAVHVNKNSIRLLTAYIAEAVRMGFDEYAAEATQQLEELKNSSD